MPKEIRNTAGRNSSNESYGSNILYEADANATYSTSFTTGANFSSIIEALFYSPSTVEIENGPPGPDSSIVIVGYTVGPNGTGKSAQVCKATPPILNDKS